MSHRKIDLQPEEVLTAVRLPLNKQHEYVCEFKQAHRREDDIAIVNAGMRVWLEQTTGVLCCGCGLLLCMGCHRCVIVCGLCACRVRNSSFHVNVSRSMCITPYSYTLFYPPNLTHPPSPRTPPPPDGWVAKDVAISYGGVAPRTISAPVTETTIKGKIWGPSLLTEALGAVQQDVVIDANAPGGMVEFRQSLSSSFLFKFFLRVAQQLESEGASEVCVCKEWVGLFGNV